MLIFSLFSLMMFMGGLLTYGMNRKHLLLMLLSLEMLVLAVYFIIFIYFSFSSGEFFFSMIFLAMSVCESVLGLSILVLMVRSCGNDYVLLFSSLW